MTLFLQLLLLIGIILMGLGVIAAPIILVILLQNSQRRKMTRMIAAKFDLTADLDEMRKITRAKPSAAGVIDDFELKIEASESSNILYNASVGTRSRMDMGKITVGTSARKSGVLIRTSGGVRRDENDFAIAFSAVSEDGSPQIPWLTDPIKMRLVKHRTDFSKIFAIKLDPYGDLTSLTHPMFSRKVRKISEDRALLMLEIAKSIESCRK